MQGGLCYNPYSKTNGCSIKEGGENMTMRERIGQLEQLRYLRREVDLLSQRIAELELAAQGGAGRITGMPRSARRGSPTEEFALKVVALEDRLEARRDRCMALLGELYAFIDDIDDSFTRLIFTYRYIDGLTWQAMATKLGCMDESGLRKIHNKYLRQALAEAG